uniref:Uncharacterized protein n=1 Tax=Candidatus Kentrum sp. LFY TaxID=2126342 RepID=A0A450WCF0_9GAMM|nr:MAG: hypothetical protein BECKLFY1418C_GA0070996_101031 [Candidatus Kentron sp. LFY]
MRYGIWNNKGGVRASQASGAMFQAIKENVLSFRSKDPSRFVGGSVEFGEMPDSHSVTIVCSHHGKPLYDVKPGSYPVHDARPQVNSEPLERYKEAVKGLLSTL